MLVVTCSSISFRSSGVSTILICFAYFDLQGTTDPAVLAEIRRLMSGDEDVAIQWLRELVVSIASFEASVLAAFAKGRAVIVPAYQRDYYKDSSAKKGVKGVQKGASTVEACSKEASNKTTASTSNNAQTSSPSPLLRLRQRGCLVYLLMK
jgi:hypothetical protein